MINRGFEQLMGFELYDLVRLSPTEAGVVTAVGREELIVITNAGGQIRHVRPEELRGGNANAVIDGLVAYACRERVDRSLRLEGCERVRRLDP